MRIDIASQETFYEYFLQPGHKFIEPVSRTTEILTGIQTGAVPLVCADPRFCDSCDDHCNTSSGRPLKDMTSGRCSNESADRLWAGGRA